MKLIRYTVIIVFCLSLGVFLIAKSKELISKDPTLPTITSDRDVLEIPCEYTQRRNACGGIYWPLMHRPS